MVEMVGEAPLVCLVPASINQSPQASVISQEAPG
jgi:hypothetical protein